MLGLVLFFLLIPAGLIGWKANLQHLETWSRLVLPQSDGADANRLTGLEVHTVRNQSLGNAVYRLGNFVSYVFADGPDDRLAQTSDPPVMPMDAPVVAKWLLGLRIAVLLALLAAAVRLGRGGDALGQASGFALACVAMLVVSPISRGHYFMFLAPAVWLVPLWLDRRGMARAATVMAVVPAVLSVLHYALLAHVGRIGLLGLGITCWLIAACVLVETAGRRPVAASAPDGDSMGRPMATADRAA